MLSGNSVYLIFVMKKKKLFNYIRNVVASMLNNLRCVDLLSIIMTISLPWLPLIFHLLQSAVTILSYLTIPIE